DNRERGGITTLRLAQQSFPKLACRMQLWPCNIEPPQAKQDLGKLWGLAHLLAQLASLGVGILHLGRCVSFGHEQCRAEANMQGQGVLGPLRRLWQGLE